MKVDGLTIVPSEHGPAETMDRLVEAVTRRGMTVVARIDHAAAAVKADLQLRPTQVLVFGNPKAGTPLMQALPTLAIDLPLRMLVWQDDSGRTMIGYDDPAWLVRRHGEGAGLEAIVGAMAAALAAAAAEASGSKS